MASFTKKVLGLAGVATAFAGMAFGQAVCTAPTASTTIVRSEGTAEQISAVSFTCTSAAANTTGTASVQLYMTLPVTSRITTSPATEARISMVRDADGAGAGAPDVAVTANGSVSGSTISFPGISLTAVGAAGTYTFTIDGVRVNASANPSGAGGLPVAITATPYISAPAATLNTVLLGATQVGFAQSGLNSAAMRNNFTATAFPLGTVSGSSNSSNSFVICNTYKPGGTIVAPTSAALGTGAGLAFTLVVGEGFASAFKTAAQESTPSVTALVNGTRLSVNFANVPAGVTIAVPNAAILSTVAGPVTAIQYTTAAIGTAPAAPSGASTSGSYASSGFAGANGLVPVTITNGSGSAIFEVTASDSNALDTFNIPVFVVTTANGVTASTTGITASVNFAPTGASTVPNFVIGATTNTLTASSFATCTTSLLFPFVTNQLGFDTGLAISNTSTDPFGTKGATNQSGTCSLNFYGSGAPSPANVTTPNVPTGTVYTQVLSGVASGFQGYVIAQCNFQFAHGFAFITNGVGVNGGLSQGYLAGVIPDVNQGNRVASDASKAVAGAGETLGN